MNPEIRKVRGGWAAIGVGWAVFGETEAEAIERYAEAERRHAEIDKRPLPAFEAAGQLTGQTGV